MQNQNQVFEDFSRLMSSIAGTVAGAGREAESRFKDKLREAMGGQDFVSREEFDAIKTMAAETKAELEAIKAELAALKADKSAQGPNADTTADNV